MKNKENENLKELAKKLKLTYMSTHIVEEIEEANLKNVSYSGFLASILEKEWDLRKENGVNNRIRQANFPYKRYLEDLVLEDLPQEAKDKVKLFSTLNFIETGQNIILAGNPGTGKTHMAIGLGIKACIKGYKVLFTTIPLLVNELKESRIEKTLKIFKKKFEKYDLVIADELGYISFDKEGAELLFSYLSLRSGRKSTIITTNLSFERWNEIFRDPVMTAAMVDRLTHKSYMVNMNENSYRLKETQNWLENQ